MPLTACNDCGATFQLTATDCERCGRPLLGPRSVPVGGDVAEYRLKARADFDKNNRRFSRETHTVTAAPPKPRPAPGKARSVTSAKSAKPAAAPAQSPRCSQASEPPLSYDLPPDYVVELKRGPAVRPHDVGRALSLLINEDSLTVDEYLPRMGAAPFFLVAATGLGKTVAVPPHVWLRQCESLRGKRPGVMPRTWVVEPRVLIADEQAPYMSTAFSRQLRRAGVKGQPPALFGAISSKRPYKPEAPIRFVTTGIFTGRALAGEFEPGLDRIIIDEAHETIAQNPDVELAIAICRQAGVTVDYMSATVDISSIPCTLGIDEANVIKADKQRHPIYINNLGQTMDEAIVDVVRDLLIRQDRNSPLLPPSGHPLRDEVLRDIYDGPPRGHGLLVAINSKSGPTSDAVRVRKLLEAADLKANGRALDILLLTAEVNKIEKLKAAFDDRREQIDAACRPYVVIATSVIEMGVTIATLDFVVTMDSGYTNVLAGDRTVPATVPLPFNSLKQRLGRVGRRRAGVGLITKDVGARYTEYPPERLNGGDLEYEPVRTPLAKGPLQQLAYFTYQKGWRTDAELKRGLEGLVLPSRRELAEPARQAVLAQEREYLKRLGVVDRKGIMSALGTSVRAWVGDGHLPYAIRLQQALQRKKVDRIEVLFWTVALAVSDTTLSSLMQRSVRLDGMVGAPAAGLLAAESLHRSNELAALFQIVAELAARFGPYLNEDSSPLRALHAAAHHSLERQCEVLGMNPAAVTRLLNDVGSKANRIAKVNPDQRAAIRSAFGSERPKHVGEVEWPGVGTTDLARLDRWVAALPGRPALALEEESRNARSAYFWRLGARRIAEAGAAVPAHSGTRTFTGRLQMNHEAKNGFWIELAHVLAVD